VSRAWRAGIFACALIACAPHRPPDAALPARATSVASAGVADVGLAALLEDHWAWQMQAAPEWATELGDHRYDDRVSRMDAAAAAEDTAARRDFAARAAALPRDRMSARDQMWLDLFLGAQEAAIAEAVCRFETWTLTPRTNPMVSLFSTLEVQAVASPEEERRYLARIDAAAAAFDQHLDALRSGVASGRVANRTSAVRVVEAISAQLDQPVEAWPLLDRDLGPRADAVRTAVITRIEGVLAPALRRLTDGIRADVLPHARGDDHPGLSSIPDGTACYRARVRAETTLPLEPSAVHQTGLEELARVHAEMRTISARLFGVWDIGLLFERLRSDPALRFSTREEILAAAEDALRRAEAAVPSVLGRLPRARCEVREIPVFEAPYTSIAYYRQPNPDGSKPGEYFVNTFEPETRPRFEASALAFHESVPGHHTQIAIAYELDAIPAYHRYEGATAFVEGWALYAERLADELGLYQTDLDRLGMLSFDAWRSARLVVDTGLHELGWSRDQAIAFMEANTPLARNNIVNEVDRYIAWPGQALAYKTGQLELLRLRGNAEAALGDRFDLRSWHDMVLGEGAISLTVLGARADAWVAAQQAGAEPPPPTSKRRR
jgi:uncharacterized protein (DUF885 family)